MVEKMTRKETKKAFKRINKDIEERGTKGVLERAAKRAGQLTNRGTIKVSWLKEQAKTGTPLRKKQANLALTYKGFSKKKAKKK